MLEAILNYLIFIVTLLFVGFFSFEKLSSDGELD